MERKLKKQISLDADKLLDSEMDIVTGGSVSASDVEGCGSSDQGSIGRVLAPTGGCSSCNKTNSCQTHT